MKTNNDNERIALDELPILRKQLINEIETALKQGAGANFYEVTERLRSGDALLDQVMSLWRGKEISSIPETNGTGSLENIVNNDVSAKARGERARSNWINSTLGKSVTQVKGTLFRNGRGEILGIAYGKEAEDRRDRWFLGLPENKFQSAVLLCEPIKGKINAICFPARFIAEMKLNKKFSTSHGQAKFNVIKRGENWFLAMRGEGEVTITNCVNNLANII
jgi:hypothetical protein